MKKQSYNEKRDFSKTKEPQGNKVKKGESGNNIFVIQKQDATNLHK